MLFSPVLWRFLHFLNLVWQDLMYTKHHTKQNWKQRWSSYWNFNFKTYSFGNDFGHFHCCYIGWSRKGQFDLFPVFSVVVAVSFTHHILKKFLSSCSCCVGGHDFMKKMQIILIWWCDDLTKFVVFWNTHFAILISPDITQKYHIHFNFCKSTNFSFSDGRLLLFPLPVSWINQKIYIFYS